MDDLANLVQDVKYEGELSDPRPKPMVELPLLPEADVPASKTALETAPKDEETGLKPLQFESLMREYLGYYMIKAFLKSIDKESELISMKFDFIENVDIYQACQNDSARTPLGWSIYKKFCANLDSKPKRRESSVKDDPTIAAAAAATVVDSTKGDDRSASAKMAAGVLDSGSNVPLSEWRPKPVRIHVDPSKLEASKDKYAMFAKGGAANIIGIKGDPVETVLLELQGSSAASLTLFGELKYIVLYSIWIEHYDTFLKSDFLTKYIRHKAVEVHKFKEEDFGTFRVLGRGGFGLVNGAKCIFSGKLYAMKVLDKKRVKQGSAEDLCWAERKALGKVRSPFVLNLKYAFQTPESLFLLLDLMTGGDLAFHLKKKKSFDEKLTCFYAASILEGIAHMHSKKIVYRDLKPANVLLDEFGYASLSDLGLAEQLSTKYDPPSVKGRCGTRGYWAPEMIVKDAEGHSSRYGLSVDWWSYGCFLYEMLSGRCPFRTSKALAMDSEPEKAMDKATMEMEVEFTDRCFSPNAADLISKLLIRDPSKRIGCGPAGPDEIRKHPFFEEIDFGLLELQRVTPPWKPNAADINAMSQDEIGTFESVKIKLTDEEQKAWEKWDFTSKSVIQHEVVELLMWEDKVGPCKPEKIDDSGCCTIL